MTIDEIIELASQNNVPTNVATEENKGPYTLLEKMNLILSKLEDIKKDDGTQINVGGIFQQIIDFIDDPQTQINDLEDYCNNLDATKAGIGIVNQNTNNIATLGADKQDYATIKYEGSLFVTDMNDFRTQAYEQRKNPSRSWQFEVSESVNQDLMDILGWPESNGNKAYVYVNLPYSEAGGFEIDITYMNRSGAPIFKRVMTSTLNANWKDTGWIQYVSKAELNSLSMCPSNTVDFVSLELNTEFKTFVAPHNCIAYYNYSCSSDHNLGINMHNFNLYTAGLANKPYSGILVLAKGEEVNIKVTAGISKNFQFKLVYTKEV